MGNQPTQLTLAIRPFDGISRAAALGWPYPVAGVNNTGTIDRRIDAYGRLISLCILFPMIRLVLCSSTCPQNVGPISGINSAAPVDNQNRSDTNREIGRKAYGNIFTV